ncbi:MAG: hypothetical protein AAGD34_21315, partial [Pseudomonadota bacterium]
MTNARVGAALVFAAVAFAGLGITVAVAQTFDRASCDRWRENDNPALSEMLRTDGNPSNKARACLVRIAFLRLGDLSEATYAEDAPFQLAYQARTRDYRVREDDPYPSYFLRDLADQLTSAQPAALTDSVFKNTIEFAPALKADDEWFRPDGDPRPVASTAGDLAGPTATAPATQVPPATDGQTEAGQDTPPPTDLAAVRVPRRKPPAPPTARTSVQTA